MTSTILKVGAWLSLVVLIVVTLSHIDYRPITLIPVNLERFAAFAGVALLFGLAYPKRRVAIAVVVVIVAFGLEALQTLSPTRHGELRDAAVKIAGGMTGLAASSALLQLRRTISR